MNYFTYYIRVVLAVSCCILFTSKVSAVVLPTLIINPWNPIFSCDVPTINVRVHDFINFACPDLTRNFYIKDFNDKTTLYENLFYLGDDEHAFSTCNATGARNLLRCSGSSIPPFDLTIRDVSYFPDQIVMKKGKSYYFIDTAYRAVHTLDNLIGGSCNKSENGQFKIRFKLYICTDDEINNGQCEQCTSEGCYYRDCGKTCAEWATISESIKENTRLQGRQCTNILLGTTTTEYQTVPSLLSNCTVWTIVSVQQVETNCSYVKKRTCTNSLGNTHVEFEEKFDKCQPQPTVTAQIHSNSVDTTNIYIAIGASLGSFLLGTVVGFLYHRHKHPTIVKSNLNSKENHSSGCTNETDSKVHNSERHRSKRKRKKETYNIEQKVLNRYDNNAVVENQGFEQHRTKRKQ